MEEMQQMRCGGVWFLLRECAGRGGEVSALFLHRALRRPLHLGEDEADAGAEEQQEHGRHPAVQGWHPRGGVVSFYSFSLSIYIIEKDEILGAQFINQSSLTRFLTRFFKNPAFVYATR